MNAGKFVVEIGAEIAKRIRNRPKAVARRAQKAAKRSAKNAADEVSEDFNSPADEVPMKALYGAAKSKLMWLGVAQVLYGLFELWANGTLSAESAGPVISGALTMVLRAITTGSLADKAK